MKKVSLITHGPCLGNPRPGGWACVLRFAGVKKEFFGFDPHTTYNRMELMAPIQGLLALKEPCEVEITTDSEYVLHEITKWILQGMRRHWWRKHEPVRNADLWMELDALASKHQHNLAMDRGHAGHPDNTRCDWLVQNAAATQQSSWADGRPYALLVLDLGVNYLPPKPQLGLFEDAEPSRDDDEDDDELDQKTV